MLTFFSFSDDSSKETDKVSQLIWKGYFGLRYEDGGTRSESQSLAGLAGERGSGAKAISFR